MTTHPRQTTARVRTPRPAKAWVAWSSGKDSLWALHLARRDPELEIVGLLTTITEPYGRVSMHGVREELVRAQAAALGLPLHRVAIPARCSQEVYGDRMRRALEVGVGEGVTKVVHGDVSLGDVRAYREQRLAELGLEGVFPLWGRDSGDLAREVIESGVRAYVTCLDPSKVSLELAGHPFDRELLERLPDDVDPCGERGEFHTFAWDGPDYARAIPVQVGVTVSRDGFLFTDVLMGDERSRPPNG